MALSFRRNGDGSFGITLPLHDRSLLEVLVPQMRELIKAHDPATWRLFPNPYPDHDKAADDYSDLIGDDLQERHLLALETVEKTLDAKRLDEDQMIAWMNAINHLRLFIGTRLDVTEESDYDDFNTEEELALYEMYNYLGAVLELIVRAVAGDDYWRAGRLAAAELLPFALEVVAAAGELTERFFRSSDLEITAKADGTPVTQADEGAEQLIRDAIMSEFPTDAIVGEEFGATEATSGREWVIDPIDGTKSFTAGVPLYSNLLAVIDDGVPVLGIINLPAVGETISAVAGHGAFCNGERCRASQKSSLQGAYVMTSSVRYWPEDYLQRVLDHEMILRTWGDAYGYAMVATGRAEAMIDPRASVWDVAPIGVILSEAGGAFSDLDGNADVTAGNGIGTNGVLHDMFQATFPAAGWR